MGAEPKADAAGAGAGDHAGPGAGPTAAAPPNRGGALDPIAPDPEGGAAAGAPPAAGMPAGGVGAVKLFGWAAAAARGSSAPQPRQNL